jgi:hypothetical protein
VIGNLEKIRKSGDRSLPDGGGTEESLSGGQHGEQTGSTGSPFMTCTQISKIKND